MTLLSPLTDTEPPDPATPRAGTGPQGPALSDKAFACIAELAHREAGLYLAPGKSAMVRTRLARRLRALGLKSFDEYCSLVRDPGQSQELATMVSALTTNVSHFFREEHHFDILRDRVLPALRARANRRIRIWSAGCSNGQEPYSIAITLREAAIPAESDVRILATDIDPNVIAHARAGHYNSQMMTGLSPERRDRFFQPSGPSQPDSWRPKSDLSNLITFRELNLLRDWPMRGPFDVIFCRNVVIYFDQDTQDRLWQRFAAMLAPDGWLFLGHSERISEQHLPLFASRGVTSYQRRDITNERTPHRPG